MAGYYAFQNIIDNCDMRLIHSSLDRGMYNISETRQRDIFIDELEYRYSTNEYMAIKVHMQTYGFPESSMNTYRDLASDFYDNLCTNIQRMSDTMLLGMLNRSLSGYGYKASSSDARYISNMFKDLGMIPTYVTAHERCENIMVYPEFLVLDYEDYLCNFPDELEYDTSPERYVEFVPDGP